MPYSFSQDFRTSSTFDDFWTILGDNTIIGSNGQYNVCRGNGDASDFIGFAVFDHVTDSPWSVTIVTGLEGFNYSWSFLINNGTDTPTICQISTNILTSQQTNSENYSSVAYTYNDTFTESDFYVAGVTVKITMVSYTPNGTSPGTSALAVNVYTDESLATEICSATLSNIYGGDIWSSTYFQMNVLTDPTVTYAKISFGSVGTSCLAENSLISTNNGFKAIQDLISGDVVFDDIGKESRVVKLWKTKKSVPTLTYRLDGILLSKDHLLRILDTDKWTKISSLDLPAVMMYTYYYQVQTDSYGIRTESAVFSTWTSEYIDSHPKEVEDFC